MLYTCLRFIAKLYLICRFKLDIKGLEHIPDEGGIIVAANHFSNYDPIILGCICKRKIHFLGKQELFRYRLSKWFFQKLHVIPVDRKRHNKIRPVRRSLNVISVGEVFGIFPEGKRCRNGETVRAKPGVAFFSCKTGAPVLPVALIRTKRGFRHRMTLVIGRAIDVPALGTTNYATLSQMVMERIRELKQKYEEYEKGIQPETV